MSANGARPHDMEINRMRRLILTTASVLALAIGGAGFAHATASSSETPGAAKLPPAQTPMHKASSKTIRASASKLTKSEIKQEQVKLRQNGLYRGRIDGIIGPETRAAVRSFQKKHGLPVTASLDRRTISALNAGKVTSGEGSSMPSSNTGAVPMKPKQSWGGTTGGGAAGGSATSSSHAGGQPNQRK